MLCASAGVRPSLRASAVSSVDASGNGTEVLEATGHGSVESSVERDGGAKRETNAAIWVVESTAPSKVEYGF